MNTTKKLMLAMVMVTSYTTIFAVANSKTADAVAPTTPTTYTSENIAAWIDEVNAQAKKVKNIINSPTDKDVTDTSSILTTMQSNLKAQADSSVQKGQIDQLQAGIVALQAFLNKYAYIFINNAPFSVTLSPGMQWNTDKTTRNLIVLDTTKTSDPVYSATPFKNASAKLTIANFTHSYPSYKYKYYYDKNFIKSKGSYDINCTTTGTGNSARYEIQLTRTSDFGRNYTNKTPFHVKLTAKPKAHQHWTDGFELDPGQSTGSVSNDDMAEVNIYIPNPMPQDSTKIASLAPGLHVITYDKVTNQLSMT